MGNFVHSQAKISPRLEIEALSRRDLAGGASLKNRIPHAYEVLAEKPPNARAASSISRRSEARIVM